MSKPLHEEMEAALADLRAQQARIRQAGDRMMGATSTATSKDRMVTATVDGQGRLVDLKLNGTRYRQLAPAELASHIAGTVRAAQDLAAREAASAFAGLLPGSLSGVLNGSIDLEAMFDAAVNAAAGPLFADEVAQEGEKGENHG